MKSFKVILIYVALRDIVLKGETTGKLHLSRKQFWFGKGAKLKCISKFKLSSLYLSGNNFNISMEN